MSLIRDIADRVEVEACFLAIARKRGLKTARMDHRQQLEAIAIQLTIMIQKRGKENVVQLADYRRQA